jgi:hypothetical protein
MILTLAVSLTTLIGAGYRVPAAEDKKPVRHLTGTLEKVDVKKRAVTIAIPHRIDGSQLRVSGKVKFKGVVFSVMKPQTHDLAKQVKATIGGESAKLSDIEKVTRAAQKPMPGCGCKHGVKVHLALDADGKTVTEINVREVTNELLAVDVKRETVTVAIPDYLRAPLQLNLGGGKAGQPKMILSFVKRKTYGIGKKITITVDGKTAQLADLKKVSKEAGKPDPRCGCTPPGATVAVLLSDDGKQVTQITVQPKPKAAPKKQAKKG